jgi:hypothetical protein
MTTFGSIGLGRNINAGVNLVFANDVQLSVITSNGAVTLILPSISSLLQARLSSGNLQTMMFLIADITGNAALNNITLIADGNETINGNSTAVLNVNNISAMLVPTSNGTWTLTTSAAGSGGGGGSVTYMNPNPIPVTQGGFPAGTTFPTPQTMQQMWDAFLYPYQYPAFSSFLINGQSTLIEVGIALSGNKTFNWGISNASNLQANSIAIRDVNANVLLASGLANTGSQIADIGTIVNTSPISQNWRGEAVNTKGEPFNSSNFNVTSIHPVFYGKVASGGAGAGQNRPVANQALINSGTKLVIPSSGTITLSFNTTPDDYMWFAVPAYNPLKTIWYVNALNTGNIGGAVSQGGNLFPSPDSVSIDSPTVLWNGVLYRIYIANYQSEVTLPMELRNN